MLRGRVRKSLYFNITKLAEKNITHGLSRIKARIEVFHVHKKFEILILIFSNFTFSFFDKKVMLMFRSSVAFQKYKTYWVFSSISKTTKVSAQ